MLGLCDKIGTFVQAGTAYLRCTATWFRDEVSASDVHRHPPGPHGGDHAAVCEDFGCELVEFNGETEHVHLLVNFPPTVALSRLVNSLKGVSSRRLRQEFPDLARHYWRARRLWSGSYFAGSVGGAPLNVLRAYIEQQRRPHDAIHLRPEGRSPLANAW
jgi:putative transposase